MGLDGIGQSGESTQTGNIFQQVKNLLELQGELIVELLESAKVPGPADTSVSRSLGTRIDIHV